MREKGEEGVEKLKGIDLVVEEWTEPRDGEKEIFFRNLFSVVGETRWRERESWWGGIMMWVQLMLLMWELDNFEVVWDLGGGGVETGVTYGVMGLGAVVGRAMGLRAVREEYTPEDLLENWERGKGRSKGE